jgi:iron complex transport system permease protein
VGRVAHERGRSELLLAGIAINALVGAAVGLVSQLADDAQLRDLVFWTLGGLGRSSWTHVASALPWVVLSVVLILRRSAELDALALGPREASYLGVDVARTERALAVAITLGVGAAVAVTGLVGFVGLVVPHVARALVGPAHRAGLVVSALLGAWLLLVADTVARTIASPVELPVGLLTAMVGGPFFLGLVVRRSREA